MTIRNRKYKSIKNELLIKAHEAMLSAVQIFNNPNIKFKSESFIVLSNISWMYGILPPKVGHYKKTKTLEFSPNKELPLYIWYNGLMEACKNGILFKNALPHW